MTIRRASCIQRRATLLGLLGLVTASSSVAALAQSPSPALIARGQSQFKQSCAFCHGADATGGRGPDLVRSAVVAHDVKGNLIGPVILNGRPDKGMPPQALSAPQIAAIAAFLHNRAHEALQSAEVPRQYPLAKLLTGKVEAGRAYFNGAGGCTACHSPAGDLKGIAGKYQPIRLQSRMLYPRSDKSKSTVTVTLPSGERVEGPLLHIDEFTVALRDSSGWYRSFSRDNVTVEVHDPLAAHRKLLDQLTQEQFHDLFAYIETMK
jgi:cytochrome c oxidase cbb3-type subunit 3